MNLLEKARETALSVLPVLALGTVLGLLFVPAGTAPTGWLLRFLVGGALLVVGLTLFLLGVDLGIQPMGERCGAALTAKRSLPLLVGAAFVVGLVVTAAEPDVQVFGEQVRGVFPQVAKTALTFSIAAGVGLFMAFGLWRTTLGIPLKPVLAVCYLGLFALAAVAPKAFVGVAFDSGGATTGPMTVPFIMALGLGVAGVRAGADRDGGFGLAGIASVGPVLAVLVYSLLLPRTASPEETAVIAAAAEPAANPFAAAAPAALHESLVSIAPLFGLFLVFQFSLLRMTARQVLRLSIGFVWAFLGLAVLLCGVNGGFMEAGRILGGALGGAAAEGSLGAWARLIGAGALFGAVIVCAEPAVWVLSEQVERASGGNVSRRALLVFLSAGTALAIALATWRSVTGFPLFRVLVPGYALALLLLLRSPTLFAGIAFDSGGVASGPLTSTFVLSFTLGAAAGGEGGNDSFGVVALVAMMPLIAIQLLGLAVERKQHRGDKP